MKQQSKHLIKSIIAILIFLFVLTLPLLAQTEAQKRGTIQSDTSKMYVTADTVKKSDTSAVHVDFKEMMEKLQKASEEMELHKDCIKWVSTLKDKMTDAEVTYGTDKVIISSYSGQDRLEITLMRDVTDETVFLSILVKGNSISCVKGGDKINILFVDDSKLELANDGHTNCKGDITVFLGTRVGNKPSLEQLCKKKIATIRVWTMDTFVQCNFSDKQATTFMNQMNCLANKQRGY